MTPADRHILRAYVALECAEELLSPNSVKGQQVHAARGVLEISLAEVLEEMDARRKLPAARPAAARLASRLGILAAACLALAPAAPAATVTATFGTGSGSAPGYIKVTFTPIDTPYVGTNGTIYLTVPVTAVTTNGTISTNIVPGLYATTISTGDRMNSLVPETTNTVDLATISTNLSTFAWTNYAIPIPYYLITNALSSSYFTVTNNKVAMIPGTVVDTNNLYVTTLFATAVNSGAVSAEAGIVAGTTMNVGSLSAYQGALVVVADNAGLLAATNTAVIDSGVSTNGFAHQTLAAYPTNLISLAGTNGWVTCVTNGNLIAIKTNIAGAGSFTVKHLAP